MAEVGKKAPAFTLQDQNGEKVKLSDFVGKNVVLYFYPKAMTSGCTVQACGVRDRAKDYKKVNTVVLGVSPDPVAKLKKFEERDGLNFSLLADEDHKIAEKYGVWVEKSMYGNKYWGNERTTFIIGPNGKIKEILRKVKPKEHDEKVLAAIAEIS